MKRIAQTGADHTNYRRRLNRAYLVLSLIWIFAGLIHPLYQDDQLRAQQLSACLHETSSSGLSVQDCYDRDKTRVLTRQPIHAFEATYGEVREWPISIFLVCVLPPTLCYCLIRVIAFASTHASQILDNLFRPTF